MKQPINRLLMLGKRGLGGPIFQRVGQRLYMIGPPGNRTGIRISGGLSASSTEGANPSALTVVINATDENGDPLAWSLSESLAWASFSPTSGTGETIVTVTLDPVGASLAPGAYEGEFTITAAGAENSPYTGALRLTYTASPLAMTVTSQVFEPSVYLYSGSTATVEWYEDNTLLATGAEPTIDFGSAANRTVRLVCDAPGEIEGINLGFNNADDLGRYALGVEYNKAAEQVTGIAGLRYASNLRFFCAANGPLTGTVDCSGLSSLEFFECYYAAVEAVDLTGCTSLLRLVLEYNSTAYLDLNPVRNNLYDLRAAGQDPGTLTFAPLSSPMEVMYHYCVRNQAVNGLFTATDAPVVEEYLLDGITNLPERMVHPPLASLATFHGSSGLKVLDSSQWDGSGSSQLTAYDSQLESWVPSPNPLNTIGMENCALSSQAIDAILVAVEDWGTSNGTLALADNEGPSQSGASAIAALEARGWTVTADPPIVLTAAFDYTITDLEVSFDAGASSGPSSIVSYAWDFGDGDTGTGVSPTHTYDASDTYTVELTVTDANSDTDTDQQSVAVVQAGATIWEDTFDRADATGVANVGNGWDVCTDVGGHGDLNIVSNALQVVDGGGYGRSYNPAETLAPSDLLIEADLPQQTDISNFGIMARFDPATNTGIKAMMTSNDNSITVGDASGYSDGNISLTIHTEAGYGWTQQPGGAKFGLKLVGTSVEVYANDVLWASGTLTEPRTGSGKAVGIVGQSDDRFWNAIRVLPAT